MRSLALAILLAAAPALAATAQTANGAPPPQTGRLLNQDYLTSTGETVQRPGVPQASPTTPLDRSIQRRDNKIENSICSNC